MAGGNIAPPPGDADSIDDSDLTFYFPSSSQNVTEDGSHGDLTVQAPASDIITSHALVNQPSLTVQPPSFADAKAHLTSRVNKARESLKKSGDFDEHQISIILEGLKGQSIPINKPIKKPASSRDTKARYIPQINKARKSLEKSGDFSETQINIIIEGLKQAKSTSSLTSSTTRPAPAASAANVRTVNKRSLANDQKALRPTFDPSEVRQSLERSGDYTEDQIKVILQGVGQGMPLAAPASSSELARPSSSLKMPSLGRSIFKKTPQSKALSPPGAPISARPLGGNEISSPTPLPKTIILPGAPRSSKLLTTFSFPQMQTQTQSAYSPPGAPRKRSRDDSPPPLGPVFKRTRTNQSIKRTIIPVTVTTKHPLKELPIIIDLDQTTTLKDPPTIIDLTQEEPIPTDPATLPPSNQKSPLLALPGELRNRIYRYALLKAINIEINRHNYTTHQPSLLKTNRQIRHEALPIFYLENKISARIHDWSPAVKERLNRLLASHNLKNAKSSHDNNIAHNFSGGPNWGNLISWLKAVFEGRAGKISECVNRERSLERKTVGAMFLIVRKARCSESFGWDSRDMELAWERVLEVLMAHRGLLGMGDPRWLD